MRVLNPTPRERMSDAQGRPYFLWDMDVTLERFEALLREADETTWGWLVGKLMRQAKPDDVFEFVTREAIRERWTAVERHLGRSREFWSWLLGVWEEGDRERR
jgi:hypothetical protein